MSDLPQSLKDLKELEAKATKGPWELAWADVGPDKCQLTSVYSKHQTKDIITTDYEAYGPSHEDARLIIALRNAAPQLIKIVETAAALLSKMERIQGSDEYKSIWMMAAVHGQKYTGDNWAAEYEALRVVLRVDGRAL